MNQKVLSLLEKTGIDYLGVSIDSLLIFVDEANSKRVLSVLSKAGVEACEVGTALDSGGATLITAKGKIDLSVKYRESAYTKVKQVIGEEAPPDAKAMKQRIEKAAIESEKKKDYVKNLINGKRGK